MKRIAVFASGGGSDFQSIIDANEKESFCEISLLVASKSGIFAIERAKKHNIPFIIADKHNFEKIDNLYEFIIKKLSDYNIDYIVLAGYLSILSPNIVSLYKDRIINIHPSLIPSFCGKGYYGLKVHKAVIDYGAKISGATVHFVDEEADTGAIILQEVVRVKEDDSPETLQSRILEVEHRILPQAVKLLVEDKIILQGRKTIIKE